MARRNRTLLARSTNLWCMCVSYPGSWIIHIIWDACLSGARLRCMSPRRGIRVPVPDNRGSAWGPRFAVGDPQTPGAPEDGPAQHHATNERLIDDRGLDTGTAFLDASGYPEPPSPIYALTGRRQLPPRITERPGLCEGLNRELRGSAPPDASVGPRRALQLGLDGDVRALAERASDSREALGVVVRQDRGDLSDGRSARWHSVGTFRRSLTVNGGSRRSPTDTSLQFANSASSQLSDHDPR